MKILMVEPGKAPKEKNISGTLDSMQEAVGGTLMLGIPDEILRFRPSIPLTNLWL